MAALPWRCAQADAHSIDTVVRNVQRRRLPAALNFYAESPDVFDDESVNLGLIFATHAALIWNMMRRDQQFRVALVSRDIIGQAKGRLMERFDIDAAEAFERLKQMSQDANTPIAQVAQRVTGSDSSLLK